MIDFLEQYINSFSSTNAGCKNNERQHSSNWYCQALRVFHPKFCLYAVCALEKTNLVTYSKIEIISNTKETCRTRRGETGLAAFT